MGGPSITGENRATETLGTIVGMSPQRARVSSKPRRSLEGKHRILLTHQRPSVCAQGPPRVFLTPGRPPTWNTVMMAAGKVSKFAEGVPSLKLNLRRKFRGKNGVKILTRQVFPSRDYTIFITSSPLSAHTFPPCHVICKDGI